jgi:hypothetical protein
MQIKNNFLEILRWKTAFFTILNLVISAVHMKILLAAVVDPENLSECS